MMPSFLRKVLRLTAVSVLAISWGAPAAARLTTPDQQAASGILKPTLYSWQGVNDWHYQLQNLSLKRLGLTRYDLVVIDYSADGSGEREFTRQQIMALKNSPGGPKLVLAYLSIGEAESYRYYWQPWWRPGNPLWLDQENPDWPGNFRVRYWYPEWQRIISGTPTSYLDKIIAQGFDGVYLDKVDTYLDYEDQRPSAPREMVDFVLALAAYARQRTGNPSFGIFPQNGEGLGVYPRFVSAVTGVGQEHPSYGYPHEGYPTPPQMRQEIEGRLRPFVLAGKLVLTADYAYAYQRMIYPPPPSQVDDAYARARARGWVPFVTTPLLDHLVVNPGHEPD